MFEFICGKLPFGDKLNDPYEIFRSVRKRELFFPAHISQSKHKDTISLIDSLLVKDPLKRLENGWEDVKTSDFFKGYDWSSLASGEMEGPYVPKKFRSLKKNDDSGIKKSQRMFKVDQYTLSNW